MQEQLLLSENHATPQTLVWRSPSVLEFVQEFPKGVLWGGVFVGNGPNTFSGSTAPNTELSEFWAH